MSESILNSPVLYTVALTLLHFLWQGCLVALALKVLLSITSYKNPQLRYAWASCALVICLVLPIVTFNIVETPDYLNSISLNSDNLVVFSEQVIPSVINPHWYYSAIDGLPLITLAWVFVVIMLCIKLIIELTNVQLLTLKHQVAVNPGLQLRFEQLYQQFSLWRKPTLIVSLATSVPMAVGWLKPAILIPASMVSGLNTAQLEMLILHELAHIKRHDYLVNFLQTLVEILLFFHPAVSWISKQMRNEREYCSDDIAVKHCGCAVAYAHALADTASHCHQHRNQPIPNMAMAASGGDLKQRIVRLVGDEHSCSAASDSGKVFASLIILFAILSIFSKPIIDNEVIDWGAGRISLMQSASEFIDTSRFRDNDIDALPRSSLAQLLVNDNFVNLTDKESVMVLATDAVTKPQRSHDPISDDVLVRQASNKGIEKDEKSYEKIAHFSQAESNVEERNHELLVDNDNTPLTDKLEASENSEANVLLDEIKEDKQSTLTEQAFARTDSDAQQPMFENPYAKQVASLIDKPLPQSKSTEKFNAAYNQVINQTKLQLEPPADKPKFSKPTITRKTSAKLVSSVDPKYPSIAKRRGIEIDILVEFVIDKDGRISNLEFEQKNRVSYFRNAIRTAMNQWRFLPAKVNEKPVESKMAKIFSFNLLK